MSDDSSKVLILACGALAHDILAVLRANRWSHVAVQCLPADLHNRPDQIPSRVRAAITANRDKFARIFVAYADCGTAGELDRILREEGVERIPGAHCYEFFAGTKLFEALADEEPGTFYLTDFLARHFDRVVIRGLGLDRNPELLPLYFGQYRRVVYLSQSDAPELLVLATDAATRLDLEFEHRHVGHDNIANHLSRGIGLGRAHGQTDRRLLA
ncbi:MAG: DUF1638 domain-containing protein [Gammaproteobacteria bacterium]